MKSYLVYFKKQHEYNLGKHTTSYFKLNLKITVYIFITRSQYCVNTVPRNSQTNLTNRLHNRPIPKNPISVLPQNDTGDIVSRRLRVFITAILIVLLLTEPRENYIRSMMPRESTHAFKLIPLDAKWKLV